MFVLSRVIKKELLQLRRDPRMFPILFIAPILQLLFMGYAATLDIKHVPIVFWDQDHSAESRQLIAHVSSTLYFDDVGRVQSYNDIQRAMRRGSVIAALVIPPGFEKKVKSGRTASVQALLDGSDSNQALIAGNYLSIIIGLRNARIVTGSLSAGAALSDLAGSGAAPVMAALERMSAEGGLSVMAEPRVWYNPELRSADFMVPGVVVMLLLVITMMLTALGVVREKEVGTMEQVIVTPIRPWQFIVGKIAPFIMIGYVEVTLVVLVAVFWFQVPFNGSIIALYGYTGLFLLTTLGGGLFLSTISSNQQQAMMTAFFIMFTMILLSGFMFPIENMPRPVQWLTYAIPMRYFLVIVRSVFLKGSTFSVLWPQALGLFAIGAAVITLSVKRFGKTLD